MLFLSAQDLQIVLSFQVMKKTHYYLIDKSNIIPGAAVSELQFNIIKEDPFVVHDLKVEASYSTS